MNLPLFAVNLYLTLAIIYYLIYLRVAFALLDFILLNILPFLVTYLYICLV